MESGPENSIGWVVSSREVDQSATALFYRCYMWWKGPHCQGAAWTEDCHSAEVFPSCAAAAEAFVATFPERELDIAQNHIEIHTYAADLVTFADRKSRTRKLQAAQDSRLLVPPTPTLIIPPPHGNNGMMNRIAQTLYGWGDDDSDELDDIWRAHRYRQRNRFAEPRESTWSSGPRKRVGEIFDEIFEGINVQPSVRTSSEEDQTDATT